MGVGGRGPEIAYQASSNGDSLLLSLSPCQRVFAYSLKGGESNRKRRALAGRAFNRQRTAITLDDQAADAQT